MATVKVNGGRGKVPGRWDEMEAVLADKGVTADVIVEGLLEIANNGEKDRDRLRAWEAIAQYAGLKPPERIFVSTDEFELDFNKDS